MLCMNTGLGQPKPVMTGWDRTGANRSLDQLQTEKTGPCKSSPVVGHLSVWLNRLEFQFMPKMEKNRTFKHYK